MLTPAADAAGDPDKRWDTARIAAFNEILGFYGLAYWYTWQVTILGLGPIWQSDNDAGARRAPPQLLDDGAIFAFGLSEREHGADIYSTDMVLDAGRRRRLPRQRRQVLHRQRQRGRHGLGLRPPRRRRGPRRLRLLRRRQPPPGLRAGQERRELADVRQRVPRSTTTRSRAEDVLHTGRDAFDAALNTVNVGKFNLGFASIGICEHAFYEAITHADNRVLYGKRVTEFPHVRRELTDAYARLVAMKLFGDRADRLLPLRQPRGPPLPALQPDHEDEGDDRGRAGHRPALGRDRRQGLREGHLLRDGRARHPRRCPSSRAPCTSTWRSS